MKILYAMRHAKSDWSGPAADFDRPLNGRGQKDAPRVGAFLARLEPPARILSSPARRARQTAEVLADALRAAGSRGGPDLAFDERLYGADPGALAAVVASVGADVPSLLVVAHNPGMEDWVRQLCGARVRLPTAAVACLALQTEAWDRLGEGAGQLQWLVIPELLKGLNTRG